MLHSTRGMEQGDFMTIQIMIVGDDATDHSPIEAGIRMFLPDAVVVHTYGAASALDHLHEPINVEKYLPDLIIATVNMSGHGGWALVSALRAEEGLSLIPVIMTAMEMSRDPESSFQALASLHGIAGALQKPIETESLMVALRRIFPEHFPMVRFLVANDDPNIVHGVLKRTRSWLGVLGYEDVRTVTNSAGVFALLDVEPSLGGLIVGMRNPETLYRLLDDIREREIRRHLPILVMADKDDLEFRRWVIERGATGFIDLPLIQPGFSAAIKAVFGEPPAVYAPRTRARQLAD